jgi:hypothetical protein
MIYLKEFFASFELFTVVKIDFRSRDSSVV